MAKQSKTTLNHFRLFCHYERCAPVCLLINDHVMKRVNTGMIVIALGPFEKFLAELHI